MYSRQTIASSTEMGGIANFFSRTTSHEPAATPFDESGIAAATDIEAAAASEASAISAVAVAAANCASRLSASSSSSSASVPNASAVPSWFCLRWPRRSLYLRSLRESWSARRSSEAYMSSDSWRTRITCLSRQSAVTSAMCASLPLCSVSCRALDSTFRCSIRSSVSSAPNVSSGFASFLSANELMLLVISKLPLTLTAFVLTTSMLTRPR
mmetsp:Transcript_33012/g.110194  ORF Transcript_33012/g.110194 Transcript_33012/m.110194 type:complete len:212 (+) Transcript_33012:248-883(+)